MEKSEVTINIHGSCVSRDIFEYDDRHLFKVNEYIARNSIFSVMSSTPEPLDISFFKARNAWQQRMTYIDYNKLLFKRFSENPSVYFLIDLIDERFSLNKIKDSRMTWSPAAEECLNWEKDLVHAMSFSDDVVKNTIEHYCDQVLSIYKPERIILYKAFFQYEYLSKSNEVINFPQDRIEYYQQLNEHFRRCYAELDRQLNCITIEMPNGAKAYEAHKWGLAPMHYDDECYKYVLDQIKRICI